MHTIHRERTGAAAALYQPLSDEDVRKIEAAAFDVLARAGLKVFCEAALDAFRTAGADVDAAQRIVRLPRSLVEDAIASNPSSVVLYGRGDAPPVELSESRVHYGTGGTAIYVLDPDTGERRPSTTEDVILNARLVDALPNLHVFTINVFPNEIEEKDDIDINRFFHAVDNTSKHVMGGVYSLAGCRKVVAMGETIAGGGEALRREPSLSFITLMISPLKIDKRYGEMTCHLAARGLPVVVPTEPICGTTSPVTLAGNVLTHTAETLAGICLVQCVNKGAPGIGGSVGSITNLRTMDHLGGPIERGMLNAAASQMAQYFQVPFYSTGGTSDAKDVDVQAAYESAMSSLLVAMSGANYIHDIAGLMEADLTVSYDKLVIDNEILGMCQRVLRGIEVNDETLATELLIEKGPGKDYIAEEHTVQHMRQEFYVPTITNRQRREDYTQDESVLARAHAIVEQIRASKAESCLRADVRDKILKEWPEIRQATGA